MAPKGLVVGEAFVGWEEVVGRPVVVVAAWVVQLVPVAAVVPVVVVVVPVAAVVPVVVGHEVSPRSAPVRSHRPLLLLRSRLLGVR